MPTWLQILAFVLVFVCGAACGFICGYQRGSDAMWAIHEKVFHPEGDPK